MPLLIINGDITRLKCDAIVNAANSSLLGGGGVDGAIHRAAGPKLLMECMKLHGCKTGEAKLTGGYNLPSPHIIHTVGPVWHGGGRGEEELLRSCYRNSLEIALENGFKTVAFPMISTGVYGYPKAQGLRVATSEISAFIDKLDDGSDMTVYIVVFDDIEIDKDTREDLESMVPMPKKEGLKRSVLPSLSKMSAMADMACEESEDRMFGAVPYAASAAGCAADNYPELQKELNMIDESFSQMVLRKIDENGMTDVECYKRANLDRKHFSKIRSDVNYRPKKQTVFALGIALRLPSDEMDELLMKAGFAMSRSNASDVIIDYFIRRGNYNIHEINEALFAFDQQLLGA